MNVHAVFRNAALLAGIGIALQGLEALLVPVWAIVALVAALPATVVFAALVCPGALEAAITIVSIRSSYAGKGLATVFADEGLFFANMKAVLLGGAFTGTGFRTEALGLAVPIRWIKPNKLFAAVIARARDCSEAFPVSDAHALSRAVNAWMRRNVRKCLTADLADMREVTSLVFACCTNVSAGGRAADMYWRAIGLGTCDEDHTADRTNNFYLLTRSSSSIAGIAALDRAEALFSRVGKIFPADGASRGKHWGTSDSVRREKNQGALLGMNACQQVMSLLKPYTKYIMKHRICQGGFYACC